MDEYGRIDLSFQPEELALLLDIVISVLGKVRVKIFHARDPGLRAALEKQQGQLESILRKLGSSTQWIGAHEQESKKGSEVGVQGRAA